MINPDGYDDWIFDLDNTLYRAECNLFAQINVRMHEYIVETLSVTEMQARELRQQYYVEHGTTLSGLMCNHNISPDHFLDYVHDIDHAVLTNDHALREAIDALPGRKLIFTNGSVKHARNVTDALGLTACFDGVFDIAAADYVPKPHRAPYDQFIAAFNIAPTRAVMFEDMAQNLEAPHQLGMTTVLVQSSAEWIQHEPADKRPGQTATPLAQDHIHHTTDDITKFIETTLQSQQQLAQ